MRESSVAVVQVALDLAQTGERLSRLNPDASFATDIHRLHQIALRIGSPILSPRLKSLTQESVGGR
jgi:hypothetical protein